MWKHVSEYVIVLSPLGGHTIVLKAVELIFSWDATEMKCRREIWFFPCFSGLTLCLI